MKLTVLLLALLLYGCDYTAKVEFKKTFDECYANIPVETATDGDRLLLDRSSIKSCYDTAMDLHSVTPCKASGTCK